MVVLGVVFTYRTLSRSKGIIDFDDFTRLMLDRWAVSKIKQSCLIPYVLVFFTYDSSNST